VWLPVKHALVVVGDEHTRVLLDPLPSGGGRLRVHYGLVQPEPPPFRSGFRSPAEVERRTPLATFAA
jgi:hypothetical protein